MRIQNTTSCQTKSLPKSTYLFFSIVNPTYIKLKSLIKENIINCNKRCVIYVAFIYLWATFSMIFQNYYLKKNTIS